VSGLPLRIFSAAHARELLHNPLERTAMAGLFRYYQSRMLQEVDHWFPVSTYTRDLLVELGVTEERTTVIHNGTDPDRFYPFDTMKLKRELGLQKRKVLLTITRLVRRKGIDDVIRAVDRLRDEFPDIAYVIVGKGPEEKGLKQMVRRRLLESHVFFIGGVGHEDLAPYYNISDLFVMPSKTVKPDVEGFGIVFLEANACGKPVIGTKSGGIPDAVIDGENGLLVDEKNIDQLSEAIRQLLHNPDRATDMGKRGRKRVEGFLNWDAVARKLYDAMSKKINA
jgi:phosphatidylinositol alpha-1,6-mannosyltransferase